jgi:hypothetical protein
MQGMPKVVEREEVFMELTIKWIFLWALEAVVLEVEEDPIVWELLVTLVEQEVV